MANPLRCLAGFLITPGQAYEAQLAGFDLYLGGQIRLPFYGVVHTGSISGKRFEMGRYQPGRSPSVPAAGLARAVTMGV